MQSDERVSVEGGEKNTDPQSLLSRVTELEEQVDEIRRGGDATAIVAAAHAAVDEIEHRIGTRWNETQREALIAVKRLTFNAASDCWPGWTVSQNRPHERTLTAALELAQRFRGLVEKMSLGRLQEGTATWLVGAFELALGRYADASSTFAAAREHYLSAGAPCFALWAEGYMAIVQRGSGKAGPQGPDEFEQVCQKILAGDFKDAPAWIEQLRTAVKVFTS